VTIVADIVMIAWVPVVLLLFAVLPSRRAVIVAYLSAWLFLPVVSYRLPFLPDYTKMSATCAGVLLGAIAFDTKRLVTYRPQWIDVPMALFCLSPFASSITNGLGVWDGMSAVMALMVTWGLPYLVGRVYFTDTVAARELAIGIFVGGLLYIPFCIFEMRMSPQLHNLVYGSIPRSVQMRFGGWRPSVFLEGGLQLGLWMTAASLIGFWIWQTGLVKRVFGVSMDLLVPVLMLVTVLCRSTGALLLLVAGLGALWSARNLHTRLVLYGLLLIAPVYIGIRTTGGWSGQQVIDLANIIDEDRAQSLQYRVENENILIAKALEKPWFGWGGWARSRVYDEWGKDISVTDGHWIIELGTQGLLGLITGFMILLAPLAILVRKFSIRYLATAEMAPVLAMGVVVALYAIDCLPNAMLNPVYMVVAGAVTSVAVAGRRVLSSFESSNAGVDHGSSNRSRAIARRLYPVGR